MSSLSAYGITVTIPHGWEGRAFRHGDGEATIHLGSFPLPRADGEFGSHATAAMPADGLFLALTEYDVPHSDLRIGLFAASPPRAVESNLLSARALLRPIEGQRGVQRFFAAAHRAFCLYVVIGRHGEPRITAANAVLASLRVVPRPT